MVKLTKYNILENRLIDDEKDFYHRFVDKKGEQTA